MQYEFDDILLQWYCLNSESLDYYYFGKIEQQNENQIMQLFQQLSQDE